MNTWRKNASKILSIRLIFILHKTFALKNDSHHDKAKILSFLAKLIMHWYLAEDALHRTFTLMSDKRDICYGNNYVLTDVLHFWRLLNLTFFKSKDFNMIRSYMDGEIILQSIRFRRPGVARWLYLFLSIVTSVKVILLRNDPSFWHEYYIVLHKSMREFSNTGE